MVYHVSKSGSDFFCGSEKEPFYTINKAACTAMPGDTVIVHEGIYREWVKPSIGGTSDKERIVYRASCGEHPVIKGSEIITGWEKVEGTVYKKVIPNSFFGEYNPYAEVLSGDWFLFPTEYSIHTGDVYINGKSMYEASSYEELLSDKMRTVGVKHDEFPEPLKIRCPEETLYRWYCTTDDENTTIYANFRDKDPLHEEIEINVRKCCFFPETKGINYLTVEGFEFANAACPFAPPTATQFGTIGPNMSKGWIIRNNLIHDAKCCGISVGNSTNKNNLAYLTGKKAGHIYQHEAVFDALEEGWSKESTGSHLIEDNTIHSCGQAGIVGHLGCVFSTIRHNHIYDIAQKQEFWGYELGGIKLHAAIDVTIENNYIHDCAYRGIWLDWQAQGTRVTKNLFHNNIFNLMIEVTHGPCTVDNNIFLSESTILNCAQGSAFINNIVAGYSLLNKVLDRTTPYHRRHSTVVAGIMNIQSGDDRFFANIFLGKGKPSPGSVLGNSIYNRHSTEEEYNEKLCAGNRYIPLYAYNQIPQPVYINDNVYALEATAFRKEKNFLKTQSIPVELSFEDGKVSVTLTVPEEVCKFTCSSVTTDSLTSPIITEQPYENPDGTAIDFTKDFFGNTRTEKSCAGPFASLKEGKNTFTVWG